MSSEHPIDHDVAVTAATIAITEGRELPHAVYKVLGNCTLRDLAELGVKLDLEEDAIAALHLLLVGYGRWGLLCGDLDVTVVVEQTIYRGRSGIGDVLLVDEAHRVVEGGR